MVKRKAIHGWILINLILAINKSSSFTWSWFDIFSLFPSLGNLQTIFNIEMIFSLSILSDSSFGQSFRETDSNSISSFHEIFKWQFTFRIANVLIYSFDSFLRKGLTLFMMCFLSEILSQFLPINKFAIRMSFNKRMVWI